VIQEDADVQKSRDCQNKWTKISEISDEEEEL